MSYSGVMHFESILKQMHAEGKPTIGIRALFQRRLDLLDVLECTGCAFPNESWVSFTVEERVYPLGTSYDVELPSNISIRP